MRFKLDENLPHSLREVFTALGHDAESAVNEGLQGAPDVQLADTCTREQRALVTCDLDFADTRKYPPEHYPGLIVLRLHHQDAPSVTAALERMLRIGRIASLTGALWILEEDRIRIREPRSGGAPQ